MKTFLVIFALFFSNSCSGIKLLAKGNPQDLYDKQFLVQVDKSKELFRTGNTDKALKVLEAIDESKIKPVEIALKNNLIGVIFFGLKNYGKALDKFLTALTTSEEDSSLTSQIHLNIAGVYYKQNEHEKAYTSLLNIRFESLAPIEATKANKLLFIVAKHIGNEEHATIALVRILAPHTTINSLQSDEHYQLLINSFFKLSASDRKKVLVPLYPSKHLIVGQLMFMDAQKRYYDSDKGSAKDLLGEIIQNYDGHEELIREATSFQYRIENYSKIDSEKIGVIVPLSGSKREFGQRLLSGIDFAVSNLKDSKFQPTLVVKDSKASGAVGRMMVRELVERYSVSAIIGGLLPGEAEKEYLETRKYGVLFISLSSINLPREMKDHLLIEVPGSIESQINALLQPAILEQLGKRGAILFPKHDQGMIYLNEFWNRSQDRNVSIVDVMSYDPLASDFREPIEKLLGLKNFRVRKEEFDLLSDIYSLDKSGQVRRVQTLEPKIDFDWIFIPNNAREALQVIPTFSYFDAYQLRFIGTPSWRNANLAKESSRLGNLFFVGDDLVLLDESINKSYQKRFKENPKIIEIRGIDSIKLATQILSGNNVSGRDELDVFVKSRNLLKGISGKWVLQDNIWLKELTMLKLKKDDIEVVAPLRKSID